MLFSAAGDSPQLPAVTRIARGSGVPPFPEPLFFVRGQVAGPRSGTSRRPARRAARAPRRAPRRGTPCAARARRRPRCRRAPRGHRRERLGARLQALRVDVAPRARAAASVQARGEDRAEEGDADRAAERAEEVRRRGRDPDVAALDRVLDGDVRTWDTIPKPSPKTTRNSDVAGRDVVASMRESRSSPTAIIARPAIGKRLVAAGARDQPAGRARWSRSRPAAAAAAAGRSSSRSLRSRAAGTAA